MLVVERAGGGLRAIAERADITRLGRGVDSTGHLDEEATARTLVCLRSFADELDRLQVSNRVAVGTSALRDAAGGDDFLEKAERILRARPRVLSGKEEAQLSFAGALSGLNLAKKTTVFDVGGGSTEIISGYVNAESTQIKSAISINIGAVRLHERYVKHDPPLLEELKSVQKDVREQLPESALYRGVSAVVGVAGTITTLFAISARMQVYEGEFVHGKSLTRQQIVDLSNGLSSQTVAERSRISGLEPRRADVVVAGALIVLEVIDWLGASSITVSDRGLRWGLVEQCARPGKSERTDR